MDLKPVKLPFGKTIYQTKFGQSVSSDIAFLVNEILEKEENRPLKLLELGSGNGILSLMLAYYRNQFEISGIEIQPHLVELAQQNADRIGKRIHFTQADLNNFTAPEKQDIIVCNPPFQRIDEGRLSPYSEKVISRVELKTTMPAVFHSISRNLESAGRAYLIYPQSRVNEALFCIENSGLMLSGKKNMSNHKKNVVLLQCQKQRNK
jgi:tRNA1(Val) A37 N6-methylase TrmN6